MKSPITSTFVLPSYCLYNFCYKFYGTPLLLQTFIIYHQLINLTQRKQPPPDLFMIKKGFVITEDEAIELRIRRRIMNRMSRRIFIPPKELNEDEYVEGCKVAVKQILLEVIKFFHFDAEDEFPIPLNIFNFILSAICFMFLFLNMKFLSHWKPIYKGFK